MSNNIERHRYLKWLYAHKRIDLGVGMIIWSMLYVPTIVKKVKNGDKMPNGRFTQISRARDLSSLRDDIAEESGIDKNEIAIMEKTVHGNRFTIKGEYSMFSPARCYDYFDTRDVILYWTQKVYDLSPEYNLDDDWDIGWQGAPKYYEGRLYVDPEELIVGICSRKGSLILKLYDNNGMPKEYDRVRGQCMTLTGDHRYVLIADKNVINIYGIDRMNDLGYFSHRSTVTSMLTDGSGRYMVTVDEDNHTHLWDVDDGTVLAELDSTIDYRNNMFRRKGQEFYDTVHAAYITPDRRYIATGIDHGLVVWDFNSGQIILQHATPSAVKDINVYDEHALLFCHGRSVEMIDVRSGEYVRFFDAEESVTKVRRNGSNIFANSTVGEWRDAVRVYNIDNKEIKMTVTCKDAYLTNNLENFYIAGNDGLLHHRFAFDSIEDQ